MTWGRQNSDEEAFEQMDYSIDQGVNFFDTAELYPVPATPERYADTEKIIGNWITSRNSRDKIILAKENDLERLNKVYNNRTHFLGELLNINQGIVSGYDKAFVFDSYDENYREFLKPFYKNKAYSVNY